jgi:hypothetical protein
MQKKQLFVNVVFLPLGLLILCFLSYGITLGKVGFFLDDWYIVWAYRTFGAAKFVEFFEGDRPLFSYVYRVFVPIFKDSALAWQLFAIFTKWLSAIALWALLKLLLPKHRWFTYSVAALFLVYPGFQFHYFSVMKSQGYALFTIYILSHIFMVLAVHNPKKRIVYTIAAIICQIIGIAPQEYYYGFELVRPLVLFFSLSKQETDWKKRLLLTLKWWLPYFVVLVSFTLFRVGQSNLYSYQISFLDQFKLNPLRSLITFGSNLAHGLFESSFNVWIELAKSLVRTKGAGNFSSRLVLIVLGGLTSLLFLYRAENRENDLSKRKFHVILVVLGIFVALAAMIPFLVGGFTIGLEWHNNRFLSPVSIGVSMLIVALIELIIRKKELKLLLLAFILGFSIQANYINGQSFINAWNQQTDFFAQLTWRAPQIKPGTALITPDLPFEQYFSGGSLTAPLNMIYASELSENPIPYQLILAGSLEINTMPDLIPDQEIHRTRTSRVFNFFGNTSNMVTFYQPQQGCLQVLSPETDPDSFILHRHADLWKKLIPLSNLNRINTESDSMLLPSKYFGQVSTGTWCYYYQQAALAEQEEDWQQVVEKYELAEQAGYSPINSSEWLPLIRARLSRDEVDSAIEISSRITLEDDFARLGLCSAWKSYYNSSSIIDQEQLELLMDRWHCEK